MAPRAPRAAGLRGCCLVAILALALVHVAGGEEDASSELPGDPSAQDQEDQEDQEDPQDQPDQQEKQQVLIFDAGSSGTRIHIFDIYTPRRPQLAHVPVFDLSVRTTQTKKVKPGLSSFATEMDLAGCARNIEDLLEFANQFVPPDRRASTPAMLKATAGLRAVEESQAQAVIDTVRKTLSNSGYKFEDPWADIIKGKEEGGLAWVAANYLLRTFREECFHNNLDIKGDSLAKVAATDRLECQAQCAEHAECENFAYGPDGTCALHGADIPDLRRRSGAVVGPKTCKDPPPRNTIGVIEMGGGSTQVTFQVSELEDVKPDDLFVFETARGKTYRLYAHSYLGYGQDAAQASMRKVLTARSDPCYPEGYVRQEKKAASKMLIQGVGESASCQASVSKSLLGNRDAPGHYASEMPIHGEFIATENFFYVQNDLKLDLDGTFVDPSSVAAAAEKACKTPLDPSDVEMSSMATGKADPSRPNYCFGMSYQAQLLEALKVPVASAGGDEKDVRVKVAHQINGADVDWALGAALVHYLEELKADGGWAADDADDGSSAFVPYALVLLVIVAVVAFAKVFGSKVKEEVLPKWFSQNMDGQSRWASGKVSPSMVGAPAE